MLIFFFRRYFILYWEKLLDMEELTGLNTIWASTLMYQHLLAAADRYGLARLLKLCESNLCEDVAINTIATTLALAEQHTPLASVKVRQS
ncbi:hypothetical protein Hanom_Chr02g00147451 [Helianthus anomalus]